jgi:hypothetical protein
MMQPLQLTRMPFAQQASTVGLQASSVPAVTGTQTFNMQQMMDMIMMIMFLVIVVKMMGGVTKGLEIS